MTVGSPVVSNSTVISNLTVTTTGTLDLSPALDPLVEMDQQIVKTITRRPPRIGMTTWPPRAGFTEEQEFQAVQGQVLRPFDTRYSFSQLGKFPADFTASPMAIDQGERHRIWSFKAEPTAVASGSWDTRLAGMFASIPVDGFDTLIYPWQEPAPEVSGAEYRAMTERVLKIVEEIGREDLRVGVNLQGYDFDIVGTRQRGKNYLVEGIAVLGVTALGRTAEGQRRVEDQLGNAAFYADRYGASFAISSLPLTPSLPAADTEAMLDYLRGFTVSREARGKPIDHLCSWAGTFDDKAWGPATSPEVATMYRKTIDHVA